MTYLLYAASPSRASMKCWLACDFSCVWSGPMWLLFQCLFLCRVFILFFFICLEVSNATEEALLLVLSLFSFMRDAAVCLEMYILDLQLS